MRHPLSATWTLALVLIALSTVAHAQLPGSLDPAFAPVVGSAGRAASIAQQSDGRFIVAGDFARVGATNSQNIARLNVDGSVDATFRPPATLKGVVAAAVGPDGKVVLAEVDYATPNGNRTTLVRLNADGSLDANFQPAIIATDIDSNDIFPFALAVQADGKVLAGGHFLVNGAGVHQVRRLNVDGSLDPTFHFAPDKSRNLSQINELVPLPSGQTLLAGDSDKYNGQAFSYQGLIRFNADGSEDPGFAPARTFDESATAIVLQTDGKILYLARVLGSATPGSIDYGGGLPRRLNLDGSVDASFSANFSAGAAFRAILLQPDGKIVVGGTLADYLVPTADPSFPQEVVQQGVARLNADGSSDSTFVVSPKLTNIPISSLGLQPDGRILAVGSFVHFGGASRVGLGRLNADGSPDGSYGNDVTNIGAADAIALGSEGLPLILSSAVDINGEPVTPLVSLNGDGSVHTRFQDTLFQVYAPFYHFYGAPTAITLAVQPDGRPLIIGERSNINGGGQIALQRFNTDGSLDAEIHPDNFQGEGFAVIPQAGGEFFAAGDTEYGYPPPYPLAKFAADGSRDPGFIPATDSSSDSSDNRTVFFALATQPDGKVLAGGILNPVSGQSRASVLRFNADGTLDPAFQVASFTVNDPNMQLPAVFAIATQPDGKSIIGGFFSTIGGVAQGNLARLNPDGSLDSTFNPGGAGAAGMVYAIALQPDGKIILGGDFTSVNGISLPGIARLTAAGTVDPQFTPGLGTAGFGTVKALALAQDGSIYLAGDFTEFNGQPRDGVARLFGGDIPPLPAVISATSAQGQAGVAFSYQIAGSNQPTSYSATGLPEGLGVDATSGLISGTPTEFGTFPVTLGAANLGGDGTATLTLTIAAGVPEITIEAVQAQASYGGAPGTFVVTRSGVGLDLSIKLKVLCKIGGAALNGVDYVTIGPKLKLKAGQTAATINIIPTKPATFTEPVKLVLETGDGYTLGGAVKAKVKIVP